MISILKTLLGSELILLGAFSLGARTPVILDSDIGGDIDDTFALLYLLKSPELDLQLVVTGDNVSEFRTRLYAKWLAATGHNKIPSGRGGDHLTEVDHYIQQRAWLGDYDISDYPGTIHDDGVGRMIELIMASPEPVRVIAVGPMQNIAEALRREPAIAPKTRLSIMGGSWSTDPKAAAHNVVRAPDAFATTLRAPWHELVVTTKEVCRQVMLEGETYPRFVQSERPKTVDPMANYRSRIDDCIIENWPQLAGVHGTRTTSLWDLVAVHAVFDRSPVKWKTMTVSVNERGSYTETPDGAEVVMSTGWNDYAGFEAFLVDRLLGDYPDLQP